VKASAPSTSDADHDEPSDEIFRQLNRSECNPPLVDISHQSNAVIFLLNRARRELHEHSVAMGPLLRVR
jgi:hypothetical protein